MKDRLFSKIFWQILKNNFKKQIEIRTDGNFARKTMKSAKLNYNHILQNFPEIGKNNPKLIDILMTVMIAAIYMAGNGRISIEQMEAIMIDGLESSFIFCKSCERKDHFSKGWQDKRSMQAILSQQRRYSFDFVFDFVYGKTFDEYGITYYECAIYKLFQREGCPELTPLFCRFDYVMAKHLNAILKRTKTLPTGGDCCDFWYAKNNTEVK